MARTGRPPAPPAPMTYRQWRDAGCPPIELTSQHAAEWCNTSIMTVSKAVKAGLIIRVDSKIRTDEPANMAWLLDRGGQPPRDLNSPGRPPKQPRAPSAPPTGNVPQPPASTAEYSDDHITLDLVLDALNTQDFSKLPGPAVQKMQRLETALKTRVDREAKRGQLIDRSLVSVVFARLYQIDTNELRTISAKVAPDVAAELGVEDPETILKIEKRIDDEVTRVLSHIKRMMNDFLTGVGAEPVPETV